VEYDEGNLLRLAYEAIQIFREFQGGRVEATLDVPTHEIAVADVDDDVVLARNFLWVAKEFGKLLGSCPTDPTLKT
jgi:hypothetical protein